MSSEKAPSLPEPITAEEAVRPGTVDIEVPDDQECIAGPLAEFSRCYRLVEVQSFKDLGILGLIPKELSEEEVSQAIHADAKIHRAQLQDRHCECGAGTDERLSSVRSRTFVQDHLIDLLQPLYRRPLTADSPAVLHPYHHAKAWLSRPSRYILGLFSLRDISIGDRATLRMGPSVRGIYARNVNMGRDSRFRLEGGGVHVRCETLNGPNPYVSSLHEALVSGFSRELRIRP